MSALIDDDYFTLVFKGNIRTFNGNPLRTETVFGTPVAVAVGDALEKLDKMRDQLDGLPDELMGEPAKP